MTPVRVAAIAAAALVLLLSCASASASPYGVVVSVGTKTVELAVAGMTAFRVSVALSGTPAQLDTPMVAPQTSYAPFVVTNPTATSTGIKTAFGQIYIDTTDATFTMLDMNGKTLTSKVLFSLSSNSTDAASETFDVTEDEEAVEFGLTSGKNDTCANVRVGIDANGPQRTPGCPNGLRGQTQAQCCAACNSDVNCNFWVLADASHPDPAGTNCWLLAAISGYHGAAGRTMGAVKFPPGPPPPPPTQSLTLSQSSSALFYGAGGTGGDDLTKTRSNAYVQNTVFYTSHYWSTDGYAALGVAESQFDPNQFANYQAGWSSDSSSTITWTISGGQVDLYLMPAASMYDGMRVYWDLTGSPPVPPKYAFGFLACRWGWTDAAYIESILEQFRSGSYPIDAWISDFEWYTPQPDYSLPNTGSPTFVDFEYNNITFPNPVTQLTHYRKDLNIRFGGIRKPRLGNSALLVQAKLNGWLVGQFGIGGGTPNTRNLNYSMPEVQAYYSTNIAHFLPDGVQFWWNDEGETMYFTFHWWNVAQVQALTAYNSTKRFFTINRAYTPGMQRLGAAIWTGDIQVSWQALSQQPGLLLNWGLAGAGYVTCDIGGFNGPNTPPDLLTRWYQVGVFLSIMRVHSTLNNMPHFPFLYPTQNAKAMRIALILRYQLLPHYYSLAHEQFTLGKPLFRPLIMEFPLDSSVSNTRDQWLSGDRVMVAPIMTSSDGTDSDTSRQVYLPADTWFQVRLGSVNPLLVTPIQGPQTITISNVDIEQIPVFVRAGSIVLLGPVIQYTDAQPGGPLTPFIFPGADAQVTLYEDDGETTAYDSGTDSVRITVFNWSDKTKTLSWKVTSSYTAAGQYFLLQPSAVFPSGVQVGPLTTLSDGGSIVFN